MASSLFLSPAGIALPFPTCRVTPQRSFGFVAKARVLISRGISEKGGKVVDGGEGINTAAKRTAEKLQRKAESSRGFSFSAAAMLFPYHAGVAQLLIEKDYIKESIPLAGASAGAIISVAIASGVIMEEVLRATKALFHDCRLHGTMFRLEGVLKETLNQLLPNDAHLRSNGRVRVAITQIHNFKLSGLLIDKFKSKEDLINALLASSFIPGYVSPVPATVYCNHLCVDGAFTFLIPPTSAAQTIGVCAFPGLMGLQGIEISPDANPGDRATILEYLNWTFWPAASDGIDRHFQCGYSDAAVWAEQNPWEKTTTENGHRTQRIPDIIMRN